MNFLSMPKLTFGTKSVDIPIIQGGMGIGISLSCLASAVAREGGIGVIAANAIGMIEPDYFTNGKEANIRALRKEIRRAREATEGVIGINLMVAAKDFHTLLNAAIEEGPDVIFLGSGLPIRGIPVAAIRAGDVAVMPIVSSGRAASLILKAWDKKYGDIPDGFVVEGPLAGGHLGFKIDQIDDERYSLEHLVPDVIEAVSAYGDRYGKNIPVIAAGGIYTGEDMYRIMDLGASAVQMATRFVATEECDADRKFKESYVNAKREDVAIIKSPVGLPGRAIRNRFLEEVSSGERKPPGCPWQCLASCDVKNARYCISKALNHARKGDLKNGYAFAGANVYRISEITTVKKLMTSLKREYLLESIGGFGSLKEYAETMRGYADSLREEYGKAVNQVQRMRTSAAQIVSLRKDKYQKSYERKMQSIRREYGKAMGKLQALKEEVEQVSERARELCASFPEFSDSIGYLTPLLAAE